MKEKPKLLKTMMGACFTACAVIFSAGYVLAADYETSHPCKVPVEHRAELGTNYQPGVDAGGKLLKPADEHPPMLDDKTVLDSTYVQLGSPVGTYLKEDKYNIPQGIDSQVNLGTVGLHDGKATYNGQELSAAQPDCK